MAVSARKPERTVIVAGIDSIFIRGLRDIFRVVETLRVIMCSDTLDLLAAIDTHPGSSAFVSSAFPICVRDLTKHAAQNRCPVVWVSDRPIVAESLVAQGLQGVIYCDAKIADAIACLHAVQSGKVWVQPETVHTTPDDEASARLLRRLTSRELQLVGMIYDGLSNQDISKEIDFPRQTVKNWVSAVYDKLDVSTRAELCVLVSSHAGMLAALKPAEADVLPAGKGSSEKGRSVHQ
jgi:DNA-binding NarL/FixJ family response regulator